VVNANFGNLTKGTLAANNFCGNATGVAQDADDYFVFNTTSKTLYYDSNGNVAGGVSVLASFSNGVRGCRKSGRC
jgi:hypothetical protein